MNNKVHIFLPNKNPLDFISCREFEGQLSFLLRKIERLELATATLLQEKCNRDAYISKLENQIQIFEIINNFDEDLIL